MNRDGFLRRNELLEKMVDSKNGETKDLSFKNFKKILTEKTKKYLEKNDSELFEIKRISIDDLKLANDKDEICNTNYILRESDDEKKSYYFSYTPIEKDFDYGYLYKDVAENFKKIRKEKNQN